MPSFNKLAKVSDIPAGEGRIFEPEGHVIAIFNIGGKFHAVDNTCLHRGGPLGEGICEESVVTCPWHGWRYDVTTGQCVEGDPSAKVVTYPVKVENDEILVEF